jgi:lipooligosaccharide transport system permease protein
MNEQRTYEAIVMTPISVGEVVAGDILWAASKSLLAGAVILAFMLPLGLLAGPLAAAVLPLTFAVGIMFGALGMAYTAIAPSYTFFNYFFTLVIGVMFLFSGVFVPLDGLPEWVGWAAWFLPLTHAVILMRALTSGALEASMWVDAVWLAAFTLAAFWISVRLIRRRLIR